MECTPCGIIGKIVDYTVQPAVVAVGRQLGYLFSYGSNVLLFKRGLNDLKNEKKSMQHRIDEARTSGDEIEDNVKDWMIEVDKICQEADEFLETEAQAKTRCSVSAPCPNWKLRHQLSRRAKKTAPDFTELIHKARGFARISYRPHVNYLHNSGYEEFGTRRETLKKVMAALTDPNITRVGVHGMPGVGKTMLAKEIGIKAKEEGSFSLAVFTSVSQTPDIGKMQDQIADQLRIDFHEKTVFARAGELRHRLNQEDKILIILDDIWEPLDLPNEVGICFEENQKGCKILMTSRDQDVLESDMGAETSFTVGVLHESEAKHLFNKIVGNKAEEARFQGLATLLIRECAGLPLAISTVAHALKRQNFHTWETALRELQNSTYPKIIGVDSEVSKSIMFSYNFLKNNEDAKKLLLFCSLHGEDEDISVENLMRCGLGLGLFGDSRKFEEARNKVRSLLDELKDRCLLLSGPSHDTVKMHDVIRDVIIAIPCRGERMYNFTDTESFKKSLNDSDFTEYSTAISLLGSDSHHQFPQRLKCTKLKLFLMFKANRSLRIPDRFFEQAKELRVLYFTSVRLESLPSSFNSLQNVETLCLHNCELQDIASIVNLKNLKILDLSWSKFEQLPEEIGQLAGLKLLNLEHCPLLKVIRLNILSSLQQLEELYMGEAFIEWEIEGISRGCFTELKNLSKLSTLRLQIQIRDPLSPVPNDLFNEAFEFPILRSLTLQYSQKSSTLDAPLLFFNEKVAFPKLEILELSEINLKKLWREQLPTTYFKNLRCLSVWRCNHLKYLLNFAVYKSLARLEYLKIRECEVMEEVVFIAEAAGEEGRFGNILFPQLKQLEIWDLPNLKRFWAGHYIQCPSLQKFDMKLCPKLNTFMKIPQLTT